MLGGVWHALLRVGLSRRLAGRLVPVLALLAPAPGLAGPPDHHDLRVAIDPTAGTIRAEDTVTLAGPARAVEVTLHAGLSPRVLDPGAALEPLGSLPGGAVPRERYRVRLGAGASRFTLRYGGAIRHPIVDLSRDGARPMPTTPGLIDAEAVYLDGASGWYPDTGAERLAFALAVDLPAGWEAVSQGRRTPAEAAPDRASVRWVEDAPQDGIYLVAAPFRVYRQAAPWGEAVVYLREEEPALARRYLEATDRYVGLYSRLVGAYPYAKFALVENAWETGYGMPSFTLLGARVIRLPFILKTSYPHEVLHNWWGNGVQVDYASGNWSEGLTSYLADHLLAEVAGEGASYRRSALQKYADYVDAAEDFPLTAFRGRHGEVSQAVGYNKALMLFHMLRQETGDAAFVAGLRRFWEAERFRTAGYAELRRAFEAASGRDLGDFFAQWVERTGAPVLSLSDPVVSREGPRYRVSARLAQAQAGPAYRLRVPVAVQVAGTPEARVETVDLAGREARVNLETEALPLRIQVDPDHDLFRRLDPRELPASFGRLLGASAPLFVLPAQAPVPLVEAYRALALGWGRGRADLVQDRDLKDLPADRPVWVLGWESRWREAVAAGVAALGGALSAEQVDLTGGSLDRAGHAFALALPHPGRPQQALGWVAADEPGAVAALARKLPHYGKYSYLAFAGPDLQAVAQGQWPVLGSPLGAVLDPAGAQVSVRTPPRPPLTAAAGIDLADDPP